ncbi:MAG: BspA family leucine-rich repeat surface protein [Firmicutes bacterium]|nr:BspA family leucine-rich repeat surface protein [Bacillota bacterium]
MRIQYKISLIIISIFLVLSLMLSSSYALWVFNVSQESANVIQSDCFEITLTDNNPIGLGASFPMRDSDGVQTTPYTFTIRNICNHPADFQINLETLNTSTIDEEFIKADLNGHITEYNAAESVEPTISGARSAAMLYEDTLAVNGEKTYNLRIWVNETATQDDVENKSFASKISVKATVKKQYAEGTLISGPKLNVALKTLAGDTNPNYSTSNTSITSIEWSENAPLESDNAINIAEDKTTTPIYAWFNDGIIYIYTELDKIYLNKDSSSMFRAMTEVKKIDTTIFDTSKSTTMHGMFYETNKLSSLDVSHFDTSKVKNMRTMFYGMSSLTSLDVSHFNTSNVTDMSYMFNGMSSLTSLDVSHFDTSNVTEMYQMFYGMSNLTSLDVSDFNTSNVTNMGSMFYGMSSLSSLDVSHFNTSNVTNMRSMFNGMSNLTSLDVSHFDTSNVTDMSYMFDKLSNVEILDVSNFDTSNVTNMSYMFFGINNITSLDVSHFDTSNVTDFAWMFGKCANIKELDLSNFDTSSAKNIGSLFRQMKNLTSLKFGDKFDTKNVVEFGGTFSECNSLEYLDISFFDTRNATSIENLFSYMPNLKELHLGDNFDTSKVIKAYNVFLGCGNLEKIYVKKNWDLSNATEVTNIFGSNKKLTGGAGTKYSYENNNNIEYVRIDDPENGKPGYFTLEEN